MENLKSGTRIKVYQGTGYTWHDNGIARFRRAENSFIFTISGTGKGLTLFGKVDNTGATVEVKYNTACMSVII